MSIFKKKLSRPKIEPITEREQKAHKGHCFTCTHWDSDDNEKGICKIIGQHLNFLDLFHAKIYPHIFTHHCFGCRFYQISRHYVDYFLPMETK